MKTFFTQTIFLLFFILAASKNSLAHELNGQSCPDATISYTGSPYCSNAGTASVTISGTTGGSFTATGGLIIDSNTGDIDLGSNNPGTYTVTYTIAADQDCVEFSTTTDITITGAPSASFNYPNNPYCTNGGTASVSFSGTTGGNFSSDPLLSLNGSTGDVNLGASSTGSYTVTYTIAGSGGCDDYSTTATIEINTDPFATISYSNSTFCTNSGIASVNLSGTTGGKFSSTGLSIDINTGDIDCSGSSPGNYTVFYTVSNNCSTYTASTNVNIESAPSASISYDGSPYCSNGGTAYVTLNGNGGGNYSSSTGLVIDGISGMIDLTNSTAGTYSVNYYVSTGNCSTSASTSVTITAKPDASISYPSSSYCSNSGTVSVTLTGTGGGKFSADWGLAINPDNGDVNPGSSSEGSYTVKYYLAAANGCGDFSTSTNISIVTAPTASISYNGSPYCSNAGIATVTLVGSGGGEYSAGNGLIFNSSTGDINLASSTPGSYTVTYSVSSNGCSVSATTDITIDAAPSATISYGGSPYCLNTGTATVTLTGDPGGSFSADAGVVINSSTGDVNLNTSTPGNYTVTYTISTTNCGQFTATADLIINSGIWTGASNSDWTNPANWCGGVPTGTTDIIIPSGLTNYPIIDGTYSINNIKLASGATLTLNSDGNLTITGSYSNSGTIDNNGRIILNGTSTQSFPGISAIVAGMHDLEINNPSGVTFDNKFTITGTLAPTDGIITLTDIVTLHSDVNNTARVDVVGATAGFSYTGNGAFTVERYIPNSGRKYRLLSPTVTTASSINANWMEGGMNIVVGTNVDPLANYGVQITGTGGNSNGFDVTHSNAPSLFNATNDLAANITYSAVTNTNGTLDPFAGYFLFIRGDRSTDMTLANTNVPPNPVELASGSTTLRATGSLVTGTQSSFANDYVGNGALNLVTNPYASPIDWAQVQGSASGITEYYTLWDPNVGFRGGFVTVKTDGTVSDNTSAATTFIQAGQAFFVESDGIEATPTVYIKEDHKVTGNNNGIFKPQSAPQQKFAISLFYTEANGFRRVADGVTTVYDNSYSAAVTGEDAREIPNWDENIAIAREGKNLSIEGRPLFVAKDTIPVFMNHMKKMAYEFQFNGSDFADPSITATLIDNFTGIRTPLSVSGNTVVPFSVTSAGASFATDRFMVVFGSSSPLPITISKVRAFQKDPGIQVEWSMLTEQDMDRYEVEKSATGTNFGKMATQASSGNSNQLVNYSWFDANPFEGDNFYRIRAINKSGQMKYSEIVRVNIGKGSPMVNVYPNPINGNSFNLEIKNMAKGTYAVTLTNQLGQQVFLTTLIHSGGSATENISLKNNLQAGVYELQVSGGDFKMSRKVVKH